MGLQNELIDMSSESFPIFLVITIANCVCYLRSVAVSVLTKIGFPCARLNQLQPSSYRIDSALCDAVGSGLAGVLMLVEQLNLNRLLSYRFKGGDGSGSDCVVCLNNMNEGEEVRKLACSHVFHKQCFDGWLDQMNFNCPLCRLALVDEENVASTRHRIGEDLCAWFSCR